MAGSLSNAAELLALNFLFNAQTATRPTAFYLGLFSDATGIVADQPATELVTGSSPGYARQAITFGAASSGAVSHTNTPTFTATGTWLTANYFGVWDALTNGNLLAWASMAAQSLVNTNQLKFDPGQITITMD